MAEDFKYLLAEQKEFCVISFVGTLDYRASSSLGECLTKVKESNCKYFILNFRDVVEIHNTFHRPLVQLQHTIRKEKNALLRLCGVNPKWKTDLTDDGTVRADEIVDNVRVALAEFNKYLL
ncbi:MAG: hypothetical protein HYV97_18455 [Bdellovibrio sp.]|nr:hypothetical protein [Bdellovibrio sp.]